MENMSHPAQMSDATGNRQITSPAHKSADKSSVLCGSPRDFVPHDHDPHGRLSAAYQNLPDVITHRSRFLLCPVRIYSHIQLRPRRYTSHRLAVVLDCSVRADFSG